MHLLYLSKSSKVAHRLFKIGLASLRLQLLCLAVERFRIKNCYTGFGRRSSRSSLLFLRRRITSTTVLLGVEVLHLSLAHIRLMLGEEHVRKVDHVAVLFLLLFLDRSGLVFHLVINNGRHQSWLNCHLLIFILQNSFLKQFLFSLRLLGGSFRPLIPPSTLFAIAD